ncbi:MAG: hypothetical protein AAB834_04845, partial [Patescibacteria group bacterium]
IEPHGTSNVRTRKYAGWHAEVEATPLRPRTLVLSCVRSHPDALTRVMPAGRFIETLSSNLTATLREPRFLIPDELVPNSLTEKLPVIVDLPRGPALAYDERHVEVNIQGNEDKAAVQAMIDLRESLRENDALATQHVISPGEVLYLDNDGLHSRTSFGPNDQNPRWLIRTLAGTQQGIFVEL